jgi:hypothetical protein
VEACSSLNEFQQLGPKDLRVNAAAPGAFRTAIVVSGFAATAASGAALLYDHPWFGSFVLADVATSTQCAA